MEKRPTSMTVIGVLLIIFALLALVGVFTMGSNPAATKMFEQMHVSLLFEQVVGAIGAVIGFACGYGVLKGEPWSRVLYVVWSLISLGISLYTSPMKGLVVFSLVFFVIIVGFLYTNTANDWFSARGFMLKREGERG
jgi:hypothetical protein